jgi:hypothetical protein
MKEHFGPASGTLVFRWSIVWEPLPYGAPYPVYLSSFVKDDDLSPAYTNFARLIGGKPTLKNVL